MTQPLTADSVKSQLNFAANLLQEQEKEYQKNQQLTIVKVVQNSEQKRIKVFIKTVIHLGDNFWEFDQNKGTEYTHYSLDQILSHQSKIDRIIIEAKGSELLILDGIKRLISQNIDLKIHLILEDQALKKVGIQAKSLIYQIFQQGFSAIKFDPLTQKKSAFSQQDLLEFDFLHLILRQVKKTPVKNASQLSIYQSNSLADQFKTLNLLSYTVPADQQRLRFQIEGTFDNSYSLSIVNRELALALERQQPGKVALFATDGQRDYEPNLGFLQQIDGLEALWRRSKKKSKAEVVIRYLFPPRVADMDGSINLCYFAWEESQIPAELTQIFNRYLDGLLVPSNFVKQVLIDSGVYKPIQVTGHGIEQVLREERKTYSGYLGKSFRFLHISSGFPRKGLDVLLQAYSQAFTAADDVSLVIKTSPNIHNTVHEQIRLLQKTRAFPPDIILITDDLPTGYIIDLYQRCHALVAPSRGEGFGLPLAEAMLFGLPVITTRFGGQTDFCTEETSWLVDFQFEKSQSHLSTNSSVWANPDVNHLAQVMRQVYQTSEEQRQVKIEAAKAAITQECIWDVCASRVREFTNEIKSHYSTKAPQINMGWVTSWNTKCGIAGYSKYFVEGLLSTSNEFKIKILANYTDHLVKPDDSNVIRCWQDGETQPDLTSFEAEIKNLDVVIIQQQNSLIKDKVLGLMIAFLHAKGIKTIVIFHSFEEVHLQEIVPQLALVDRLLVHRIQDLNRLKIMGLVNNVMYLSHGVMYKPSFDSSDLKQQLNLGKKRILASYGFLFPHKGIEQLIEAFAKVKKQYPDSLLFLLNSFHSNPITYEVADQCKALISKFNLQDDVIMINDFLDEEETLSLLVCADLIVFPHQHTGESSSASVRLGLTSNQPVACTPLPIFDDVKDIVHFLPGTSPHDLATGIIDLFKNPDTLKSKDEIQQRWLKENSWEAIGHRFGGMVKGLFNN